MKFSEYMNEEKARIEREIDDCKGKISNLEDKIDKIVDEIDELECSRDFIDVLLGRKFCTNADETEFWTAVVDMRENRVAMRKMRVRGFEFTVRVFADDECVHEITLYLPSDHGGKFDGTINAQLVEKCTGVATVTFRELVENSLKLRKIPCLVAQSEIRVDELDEYKNLVKN